MSKLVKGLVTVLVLLLALWTGWWFFLAARAETIVRDWLQDQAEAGVDIRHDGLTRSGWPGVVHVRLDQPDMTIDGENGAMQAASEAVDLSVAPWNPMRFAFASATPLSLDWQPSDAAALPMSGTVGHLSGSVAFSFEDWTAFGVELAEIAVDVPEAADAAGAAPLKMERLEVTAGRIDAEGEQPAVNLAVDGRHLTLPRPLPLGREVPIIRVDAVATEPLPQAWTAAELSQWRDLPGRLRVNGLDVQLGDVRVGGEGSMTLDSALRPAGQIDLDVRGWRRAIDALVEAGVIDGDLRNLLTFSLGLFGGQGGDGDRLPLTLRFEQGDLYVGPIRVAPLEPVVPDAPRPVGN